MANWWETTVRIKNNKKDLTAIPVQSNMNHTPQQRGSTKTPSEGTMSNKTAIQMEDGSTQEFTAKQKLIKNTTTQENGDIVTTIYFRNGRVLTHTMHQDLIKRFAEHGADQKLGDVVAGITDPEDCVLAMEDLIGRLEKGEWSKKSEGGGFAGASVLLRALCEAFNKPVEDIKAFLKDKTQAEKLALRQSPKLKPIIDRIEAEKATKTSAKVDTDSLLAGLE